MNFRPGKWKVIVSIVVIVIWYILLIVLIGAMYCKCAECALSFSERGCGDVLIIKLLPDVCNCGCGCPVATPISEIIWDILIILFPGILCYVIWSLGRKGEVRLKKKK
jgi:hypothetical protein